MKLFLAPRGFRRGYGEFHLSFQVGLEKDLWGSPIGVDFHIQGPPTEPNLVNLLGGVITFAEAERAAWQLFAIVEQARDAGWIDDTKGWKKLPTEGQSTGEP